MAVLSEKTQATIVRLRDRYPDRRSAVGPSLYLLQAEYGYCSREGMEEVAALLDLVPADVLSVASFYTMFFKQPVGKTVVDVCTNLACMVRGADEMLDYIGTKLGLEAGETSADSRCTLQHVECLGYCERAPMMQIDYTPYGPLTKDQVDAILAAKGLLPGSPSGAGGQSDANRDLSGTRHFAKGDRPSTVPHS